MFRFIGITDINIVGADRMNVDADASFAHRHRTRSSNPIGPPERLRRSVKSNGSSGTGGYRRRWRQLVRVIGQPALMDLDPFLLLDAFRSDNPDDYIAGFPPHPHRGFETVTYLLNGRMRHKDNAGNEGVIEPGGIQWMTAGKGIVHSEMPEQEDGLLEGFQLWINLPAAHKMTAPAYQEHDARPNSGRTARRHRSGLSPVGPRRARAARWSNR